MNKAIFILMVSVLACLLGSCTAENPVSEERKVSVNVSAILDGGMYGTRASDDGATLNLDSKSYCLRCFMEIWDEGGRALEYRAPVQYKEFSDVTLKYDLDLVAKRYKIVLWADIVRVEADGSYSAFYTVNDQDGLRDIVFPEEASFGADTYDAYVAVSDLDLLSGGSSVAVTLRRPFAKVRIVDDTISEEDGSGYRTVLRFGPDGVPVPCSYDALTGEAGYNDVNMKESPACSSVYEDGSGLCLFSGYVYVPETAEGSGGRYSFSIATTDGSGKETVHNVTDITLRRNALTTIKGKIITE